MFLLQGYLGVCRVILIISIFLSTGLSKYEWLSCSLNVCVIVCRQAEVYACAPSLDYPTQQAVCESVLTRSPSPPALLPSSHKLGAHMHNSACLQTIIQY